MFLANPTGDRDLVGPHPISRSTGLFAPYPMQLPCARFRQPVGEVAVRGPRPPRLRVVGGDKDILVPQSLSNRPRLDQGDQLGPGDAVGQLLSMGGLPVARRLPFLASPRR
jgi:hypothetical protein